MKGRIKEHFINHKYAECCHNTFSSIKRHHAVFSLLCIDVSYSSWRCAFRVNWLGFLLFCYKNGQKWTKNTLEIEEIIDTAYPPWHRDSCTNWRCTDLLHKWTKNIWLHHDMLQNEQMISARILVDLEHNLREFYGIFLKN